MLPTISVQRHAAKHGLTIIEIESGLKRTMIYLRHGQKITHYQTDARGIFVRDAQGQPIVARTFIAWCIDLGQCDHLFALVKWYLRRRGRFTWSGISSGSYPLFWKLSYRRANNDMQPHDFDYLYWGDKCLKQNLD